MSDIGICGGLIYVVWVHCVMLSRGRGGCCYKKERGGLNKAYVVGGAGIISGYVWGGA